MNYSTVQSNFDNTTIHALNTLNVTNLNIKLKGISFRMPLVDRQKNSTRQQIECNYCVLGIIGPQVTHSRCDGNQ